LPSAFIERAKNQHCVTVSFLRTRAHLITEVYNGPANRFVAGFIGSPAMNFLEFRYADGQLLEETQNLRIALPHFRRAGLERFENPKND